MKPLRAYFASLAVFLLLVLLVASSAFARSVYLVHQASGSVSVIDTASNEVQTIRGSKEIKIGAEPRAIAITPDGRFAYVANGSDSVSVIDTASNEVKATIPASKAGAHLAAIAITPNGRFEPDRVPRRLF